MGMLYTIGHSVHKLTSFINMLKNYDINYLLDVRSLPYSRHAEQFNRENIESALVNQGITYTYMGKYFGARRTEPELYNEDGYVDFEKVRASSIFIKGKDNVEKGLKLGNRIALMCTEKDPIDCHRAIMVSRAFESDGIEVNHILADGSLQSQDELNKRLLDKYFPDRDQLTIFEFFDSYKPKDYISEAYRLRNREIGYRKEILNG